MRVLPFNSPLRAIPGIDRVSRSRIYPRGAVVFHEGTVARGVYVLSSGRAKISISSADGKKLIMRIAGGGDVLGLYAGLTGKPFVFAFWAARESAASEEELAQAAEAFRDSRDEGLQHVHEIARDWHVKLSLPEETLSRYLTHNIHYVLDSENLAGMQLFFRLAASYGILPAAPELRVVPELETRNSAQ